MVHIFKSLEDIGLRGFLEGTNYVFENVVTEFFANAEVIAGTINPKNQSQGYTVPVNMVMETLVKADLRASIKLHSQKVLTSKSVQSYINKNQDIAPEGETSKRAEDTASNTGVSMPHQEEPTRNKLATQTVERKSVEDRRQVCPTNFDSEDSELDSCPLVTRRCRRKQVSESHDSESTISLPLKDFVKRRRTQRQHQDMGWTGEGDFYDEHFATGSKEPEKAYHEQDAKMGNDFQLSNQWCETQLDFMNPNDKVSDDIRNEPAPVEEYCQLLITSAWDNVSARMTIFEVRATLRKERRSLIMYKVLELELENLYHEHIANFKLDVPSVNHDFLCFRRLHKELRMIAAVHRNHRVMAGLPFINQDISYLESTSHQEQSFALEFSSLADHEKGAAQARSHQIDQQAAKNMAMTSHEHQAQENESPVQTDGHQAAGNEHQAQDGHGTVSGNKTQDNLKDQQVLNLHANY
ncbi:hypothetical protein F511_37091 [Dorcoceras hygrometricum]|uniref:Uncharacterized protein n=1 Tax=Dorcoceras hygrometricum TaxID=472368 RepID=A0A2Z7D424_9LAMI|nr:hypothetical protein F511_37091 [Dorcoceras hygrometricum]